MLAQYVSCLRDIKIFEGGLQKIVYSSEFDALDTIKSDIHNQPLEMNETHCFLFVFDGRILEGISEADLPDGKSRG